MMKSRYGTPAVGSVAWAAKRIQAIEERARRESRERSEAIQKAQEKRPEIESEELPPSPVDPRKYPPGGWQHVPGIQRRFGPDVEIPPDMHPGLPPNHPSCPNCGIILNTPEIDPRLRPGWEERTPIYGPNPYDLLGPPVPLVPKPPKEGPIPPGGFRAPYEEISMSTSQGNAPASMHDGSMSPWWWHRRSYGPMRR